MEKKYNKVKDYDSPVYSYFQEEGKHIVSIKIGWPVLTSRHCGRAMRRIRLKYYYDHDQYNCSIHKNKVRARILYACQCPNCTFVEDTGCVF